MPRIASDSDGPGHHLPGAYEFLLRKACEWRVGPDYRRRLHWPNRRWEKYQRDCERRVDELIEQFRGEPLVAPRWLLGGKSLPLPDGSPQWLQRDSGVDFVEVRPDDTLRPAPSTVVEAAR